MGSKRVRHESATKQQTTESIMLSGMSDKEKYCILSLLHGIKK